MRKASCASRGLPRTSAAGVESSVGADDDDDDVDDDDEAEEEMDEVDEEEEEEEEFAAEAVVRLVGLAFEADDDVLAAAGDCSSCFRSPSWSSGRGATIMVSAPITTCASGRARNTSSA